MILELWLLQTCQYVSIDTGHDKAIGARCIVEKMPLVIHPIGQAFNVDVCYNQSCFAVVIAAYAT